MMDSFVEKTEVLPKAQMNEEPYRHKRSRRRKKKKDRYATAEPKVEATSEAVSATPTDKVKCKKKKKKRRSAQVCLRPQNPPKAPENFTQFIMDYHENSHLFFDFSQSKSGEEQEGSVSNVYNDNFWLQENQAFETLYQSAREEKLVDWSREKLIESIKELEHKEKNLRDSLTKRDPYIILHKLQEQLIQLQEDNKRMKAEKKELIKILCGETSSEARQDECMSDAETKADDKTTGQSDSEKENRPAEMKVSPAHSSQM